MDQDNIVLVGDQLTAIEGVYYDETLDFTTKEGLIILELNKIYDGSDLGSKVWAQGKVFLDEIRRNL